jgi:hypothetical protein
MILYYTYSSKRSIYRSIGNIAEGLFGYGINLCSSTSYKKAKPSLFNRDSFAFYFDIDDIRIMSSNKLNDNIIPPDNI